MGLIPVGKPISVLVVDDNQAMTASLGDILEAKGLVVYAAASGAQALQILHEQPVDILLTDVKMPVMNGLELYRETRKICPAIPTVFMTAYAADELIQQGRAEGIKAILDKPLDIDFLFSLLKSLKRMISDTRPLLPQMAETNFPRPDDVNIQ